MKCKLVEWCLVMQMMQKKNSIIITPFDLQLKKLENMNPNLNLIFEIFYVNFNRLKWLYEDQMMFVVEDVAEVPQGVKARKLALIAFHLLHIIFSFYHFKPSSIIQLSSQFTPIDDWIIKRIKTWSFHH